MIITFGNGFSDMPPKALKTKEKKQMLDLISIKNFLYQRTLSRKQKDNPLIGRKYQ